jgi:acyl-CoA synthetase (AMP-forming)/AMP-acid ligase II
MALKDDLTNQEVAAVIGEFPGIDDANVYGVRLPNHDGRVGCAALAIKSSEFDFRALAKHLESILPKYAVPLFIRVTGAMQLTGNMKHQKHDIREQGVDPEKTNPDQILWLQGNTYIPFTKENWEHMNAGFVKL